MLDKLKLLDGRYRIIKDLAEGGFSQTYLAEDTRLPNNPQCVVKHLNPTIDDAAFTKKAQELFKAEAETLQELGKHDLIPQLYAYLEENGEFYLVQEFIEGHQLSTEMPPGIQMPESQVAQIVKEVLEILQFVHKYNVIHRDIKPSNLIRRHSDGKLVLIDFGTVKQVQMDIAKHKAKVTYPIGTPGYMSSEQARGESVASSDVYSLGMLALEALTGKHPSQFPKSRDYEVNWRSYAKVSREFTEVLDRMTRCNPCDRYQTVDEVLRDIAKLPKLSTASPRITNDRDFKSNPQLLPTAIALLVFAGGIYLFSSAWNHFRDESLSSQSPTLSVPTTSPSLPPKPVETLIPERKVSYEQLSIYLKEKNWKAADQETYLLLLKAAGDKSYNDGTFHPDEFNQITCADLVLIDQLWSQASNGKQGLTAQKKIYEDFAKDIRKTHTNIGWVSSSGELEIDTAYDRQTKQWEYIEGRQPNFKSPPVGHLPFLLREPSRNLERMVTLYRCSS